MFCTNCGMLNPDNATLCARCGERMAAEVANPYESPQVVPEPQYGVPANMPTYLAQAILVTLFCCTPFGIVAIVYAAQASGKLSAGDYHGAMISANNAKKWCWIGFGLWLGAAAIYIMMIAAGGVRQFR